MFCLWVILVEHSECTGSFCLKWRRKYRCYPSQLWILCEFVLCYEDSPTCLLTKIGYKTVVISLNLLSVCAMTQKQKHELNLINRLWGAVRGATIYINEEAGWYCATTASVPVHRARMVPYIPWLPVISLNPLSACAIIRRRTHVLNQLEIWHEVLL